MPRDHRLSSEVLGEAPSSSVDLRVENFDGIQTAEPSSYSTLNADRSDDDPHSTEHDVLDVENLDLESAEQSIDGEERDDLMLNLDSLRVPATLSWKNISYFISKGRRRRKKKSTILDNVNGYAEAGQILAILGPSGAGKTTLLNVLAGRIETGELQGNVYLNGEKRDRLFSSIAAYVEQEDVMMPTLTIRETLKFAALLRLPRDMSSYQKDQRVSQVIQALSLTKVADNFIGGSGKRGVSGGERKRTSIAMELITNPSLLFLDEPTSGLDAFNAYNVVSLLGQFAKAGRTVIMTIHQPRPNIYELFDKSMFLSQGKVLFFDDAKNLVSYLSSCSLSCPHYSNPADFTLDMITIDLRSSKKLKESENRVKFLQEEYQKNTFPRVQQEASIIEERRRTELAIERPHVKHYAATRMCEFRILLHRNYLNFSRDPRVTLVTLFQTIFVALLVGGIFFQVSNNPQGVQNRLGAVFFIILNQSFSTMFPQLNVFPKEFQVLKRERNSNSYRVMPYFLARSVMDLFAIIFYPLLFVSIAYWMVGLRASASAFFTLLAIVMAAAFCAQSLGLAISALTNNFAVAQLVATLLILVFVLFGGFYANTGTVWAGIAWLQWISFVNYTFKAALQNQFSGLALSCPGGQCTFLSGDDVVRFYKANNIPLWIAVVIVLGFAVFFRILAYMCLKWRTKRKKGFL